MVSVKTFQLYKYKSFISYSRAADTQLAPNLKSALQGFAKSWYKLRAIQVFCDQTNLTASPALWSSIEKNLGNSEYFIYLASPQAAQSKWVKKEISFFHSNTGVDKMIIVLTDGEIVWDDLKTDFDWQLTNAIPKFDKEIFTQEPVWVDLRWIRKEQLSTRDPRFLDAVANLSSVLRSVDKDILIGKDVEEHRKAKRFRLFSITGLGLLALFLVIAALVAIKNMRLSQDRLTKTYNNNGTELVKSGDYAMALPWFIEAWQNERDDDKKQLDLYRIENLFNQIPALTNVWHEELPLLKTVFRDSNTLLILSGDKEDWWTNEYDCLKSGKGCRAKLRVVNIHTGKEVIAPIIMNNGIRSFAMNDDKTLFASLNIENVLTLWNLENGKLLWQLQTGIQREISAESGYSFYSRLGFNKQSNKLFLEFEDHANIYETGYGKLINTVPGNNVSFLDDDNTILFFKDGLFTWNMISSKATPVNLPYFDYVSSFTVSPDYKYAIVVGGRKDEHFKEYGSSDVEMMAYTDLQHIQSPLFIKNTGYNSGGLKIEFDTQQHVAGINSSSTTEGGSSDEGTLVFSLPGGEALSNIIKLSQEIGFSFDSSGKKIAITCRDGSTEIWKLKDLDGANQSSRLWIIHDGNEEVKSIFTPDNKFLLTAGWGNVLKLWKVPADDFVPLHLFDDLRQNETYDTTMKWEVGYGHLSESDKTNIDSSLAFVYDIKTQKHTGKAMKHDGQVYIAVRSKDGAYIATAALNQSSVWKGSTQEKLYDFSLKKNAALQSMSFSADSKKILTAFSDYTCRVWNAATGKPITPYIQHFSNASFIDQSSATFSSDGKKIITSDYGTYWIWDANTGEPLSAPLKDFSFSVDDAIDSANKKKSRNYLKANTFPISTFSIDKLRDYAALIAGYQLDVNSSFVPLSSEEFLAKWSSWKAAIKDQ